MLGLRQKLSIGFGGLLLIVFLIGYYSISEITELGGAIDIILRENYRSVIACGEMKDAVEKMDNGLQFTLLGQRAEGKKDLAANEAAFEKALDVELHNITLPGEGEKAARIKTLFAAYRSGIDRFLGEGLQGARKIYFGELVPITDQIRETADEIARMNQLSMLEAKDRARDEAGRAHRRMYLLLFSGVALAGIYIFFVGRWILDPILRLTRSVEEIKRGNLDLVLKSDSKDEIGRLSETFNEMAASLRDFRRSGRAELFRTQNAARLVFDNLPDAVAVIDLNGKVDLSTEPARRIFGFSPDVRIQDLSLTWAVGLWRDVIISGRPEELKGQSSSIQHFIEGEEHFFQPRAIPILDAGRQLTGVILILRDITQKQQQEDLKRGVLSTVSHQLKTPLTSIRMAVHLLLEEKVGALTEKQAELLIAAREDSDRLNHILEDLLDISRIESGRIRMEYRPLPPATLIQEALASFQIEARDRGIDFRTDLPEGLPEVRADASRIRHVLGNLLSNAFRYTPPGGTVILAAKSEDNAVRFSVSDTGRGIPSQYLPRIFEQFFRVPEQGKETGAGLGLAIVKEIVEAHGGSVRVESREGEGSAFSFTLKKADRDSREEEK